MKRRSLKLSMKRFLAEVRSVMSSTTQMMHKRFEFTSSEILKIKFFPQQKSKFR
jgi:hypothetical protein